MIALAGALLVLGGCAAVPGAPDAPGAATSAQPATDTAKVAAAVAAGVSAGNTASTRPGASPASVAQAAGAAAAAATGPKPFAEVIKDAKEMPGLFRIWQKDEKVWIEIAPEQFGELYFFQANLTQGIGENRIFGGMMAGHPFGPEQVIAFRKIGNTVQLLAKNVKYTARPGTPEARAVAHGFSDSLLASAPVGSQPHPDRKSVLIEANALLFADIPGATAVLERIYRQSYSFDARNTAFEKVRATTDLVTFGVSAHYALARVAVPPANLSPGATPPTEPPSTLPDIRSMFLGFHYSLAKLPEESMRPRLADERIGYFWTDRFDFSSDLPRLPIVRYVNRWRLEKKDPSASLSEPKQPIVYWLERTVPEQYRAPIREGILEWNKAFERIGIKDAIRVEVEPDDADWDVGDVRRASVRWMTVARSGFGAIGPTTVDPRTGEILDADIGFDANSVRAVRALRIEQLPANPTPIALAERGYCSYDAEAAIEAGFALDLLEARGELEPDSPDVERFVNAYLKDVAMHEAGHTLGLTHNFRASTVFTQAQLSNPDFTRENGIAGSVMEYNPWNLAVQGERQGAYQMQTLGPYDYWAIEYGYKPIAPDHETEELARIASRSTEHALAFAMDDALFSSGLDPETNTFDLGDDPLGFAQRRLLLVRELWERTEKRKLKAGESYAVLRRNLTRGLAEARQAVQHATKYIGGLTLLRDRAGSGRIPMNPVPIAKQRAALAMLAGDVFGADSFSFPPELLRRASISYFDIVNNRELGNPLPTPDIAIDQQVLALQRLALDPLLSDTVAQRLLNNESKTVEAKGALRLSELYGTLHRSIWSELKSGKDIPLLRRNLQREHANKLASALLRPSGSMPADARALFRVEAGTLRAELVAAKARGSYSPEAKAHIAEMTAMLDEALKASIVRQGV